MSFSKTFRRIHTWLVYSISETEGNAVLILSSVGYIYSEIIYRINIIYTHDFLNITNYFGA